MLPLQKALDALQKDKDFYGEILYGPKYLFVLKFYFQDIHRQGIDGDPTFESCLKVEADGKGFICYMESGSVIRFAEAKGELLYYDYE